jgi:LETM1-like protein
MSTLYMETGDLWCATRSDGVELCGNANCNWPCSQSIWCVRQADDRAIKAEGLENLTEGELREACRARGIRGNVFGEGAPAFMRKKLADWLELSLNRCAEFAD